MGMITNLGGAPGHSLHQCFPVGAYIITGDSARCAESRSCLFSNCMCVCVCESECVRACNLVCVLVFVSMSLHVSLYLSMCVCVCVWGYERREIGRMFCVILFSVHVC